MLLGCQMLEKLFNKKKTLLSVQIKDVPTYKFYTDNESSTGVLFIDTWTDNKTLVY